MILKRIILIFFFITFSGSIKALIQQEDMQHAFDYGSKIRFAFICKFISGSQYSKLRDGYVDYIANKFSSESDIDEALEYLLEGLTLDDKWLSKCSSANKTYYIKLMNEYLEFYPSLK